MSPSCGSSNSVRDSTCERKGAMGKVRVAAFSVSLDGFGAGPRQDLQNPLGVHGEELHTWFAQTEAFRKMQGKSGGKTGIDSDVAAQSLENIGAWILGRNMFGPIRGPWKDDSWKGWWGANPPYHTQVFVPTHYPRPPLEMEGGPRFISSRMVSRLRSSERKKHPGARTCVSAAECLRFANILLRG